MKPPVHDASARQHSGEPSSILGPNGGRKDRGRSPDPPELHSEIAGLVDRSTQELQRTWRTLHHTGPPLGLSRDLIIRGLADKLQQRAHGGPSRALHRRLQILAGECEKGARSFDPGIVLKTGRDLGAAVARTHPYRPRGRGRVRIRRSEVSVADRDCRADHRGTLVGSPVLWLEQTSAPILIAKARE
jgi:hypothetical protein